MTDFKIIIFSKNRACQLELLLRSLSWPSTVLYTFDPAFVAGYQKVIQLYQSVKMVKQTDFKQDLVMLLKATRYVLFLTDDDVMISPFDPDCEEMKDFKQDSQICSLSLGLDAKAVGQKWKWASFQGNYKMRMWGYPMSVDSCIFRVSDILPIIETHQISTPNFLEAILSRNIPPRPLMSCCDEVKIINNSVNQVQSDFPATTTGPTAKELEKRFIEGERIVWPDIQNKAKTARYYRLKVDYTFETAS